MMKKSTLFIFLLSMLGFSQVHGQQDTFLVKAKPTLIQVIPEMSYLYLNEDNIVQINYSGKYKLGKVELRGGTVQQKDSSWILTATTGVEAILVVHELMKNGTQRVALTRKYKLFQREKPKVFLDGVPKDSAIDKFTVIAVGHLQAKTKGSRDTWKIVSFRVYIPNNGKIDTLSTQGDKLTLEMKRKIDALDVKKSGGLLIFDNIKCVGPNGKVITLEEYRVFLFDEKKTKAGT